MMAVAMLPPPMNAMSIEVLMPAIMPQSRQALGHPRPAAASTLTKQRRAHPHHR